MGLSGRCAPTPLYLTTKISKVQKEKKKTKQILKKSTSEDFIRGSIFFFLFKLARQCRTDLIDSV